jgi:GNAT superfamily N-acetyltransferase
MLAKNFSIQPFDMKNIPLMLEVVLPMWSPQEWDINFRRFYVEHIIRSNYFENEYHYQLVEKAGGADELRDTSTTGEFCAMAFFARKSDICKADVWYNEEVKKFPQALQRSTKLGKAYIELMDEKTRSFMKDDDIQLTLYISRKKGCGSKLLNELCDRLRTQGYKNLYLWTDCECDWEWYIDHGYELVSKDVYEPFTEQDGQDYLTYIFRKSL